MRLSPTIRRQGAQCDILGESPIWNEAEQALYWVDIRRPAIRRLDHCTDRIETVEMSELVGSIGFADDGRLLVALGAEVVLYHWGSGAIEPVAELPVRREGHRFNDGRCDRQGRFWVGTMHNLTRAPEGTLYCLEGGGGLVETISGICIPNSLAWSPDGGTMYFADSLLHTIFAYDFDADAGRIGARRVFAETVPPAFPDGSALDADGCLWNAEFNGSRIVRYAPDGRIERTIELPVERPTCCAFGGPNLDTLYVTTASQHMTPDQLAAQPLAGALLALEVGVRGLPEARFACAGAGGASASRRNGS